MILSAFLNHHYERLSADEQRLFQELLECADPQLADWLCRDAKPTDQGMATIVARILSARRG